MLSSYLEFDDTHHKNRFFQLNPFIYKITDSLITILFDKITMGWALFCVSCLYWVEDLFSLKEAWGSSILCLRVLKSWSSAFSLLGSSTRRETDTTPANFPVVSNLEDVLYENYLHTIFEEHTEKRFFMCTTFKSWILS